MPCVFIIFLLQRFQEARHFRRRNEPLTLALSKSNDARDGTRECLRNESGNLGFRLSTVKTLNTPTTVKRATGLG
jgi:hypothetical protein